MANNIVALNLNGNEYNFRPLYTVDGYGSLNNEAVSLGYFSMVDGASLLVYLSRKDNMDIIPVQFEVSDDSTTIFANYRGRELYWSDLREGQVYEFVCYEGSFYLTGDIPKTSIKYRDNKNQLRSLVIGEDTVIDLSSGVYYATTSATATRVANTLTLTGADGEMYEYNGSSPIDLSTGVNYAATAGSAPQDHYKNSVSTTAGANSSGSQISIPHIRTNAYGHVTNLGTRTHNVSVQKISKFCSVAGGQNKDKYFYIGSVLCDQAWSGYHANLSFVGAEAAWSGILYFGFRLGGGLTSFSGVELKWLSLTRSDVSDKIIMTYTDESEGRRIHLFFKYPADYLTTTISIISEGESSPKPFIFNGAVSSSLIGTVYKTSSIDSNSSSNYFKYGVYIPQGAWTGQFDLSSGEDFILECDDTIEMGPRQNGDGVYVKLATEYKQKISSLENYILTLVAENQRQTQQINDLKSTLESIVTGKTWDSNIWSGSGGATTGEIGGVETTPEMTTPEM